MDRSLTPPINPNIVENGKRQPKCSLYDEDDTLIMKKDMAISMVIDDKLYESSTPILPINSNCFQENSTDRLQKPINERDVHSTHEKITDENVKRKSYDRNQKTGDCKRNSSVPSSKDKSDKRIDSIRNHRHHKTKKNSRSKSPQNKSKIKIYDVEKRWTKTSPSIEYCENGRFIQFKYSNKPNSKIAKIDNFSDETKLTSIHGITSHEIDNTPTNRKEESIIQKSTFDVKYEIDKNEPDTDDYMSSWEAEFSLSKKEDFRNRDSQEQFQQSNRKETVSEELPINTDQDGRTKTIKTNNIDPKVLPEGKIQKYYEEYDEFIQSVASPSNVPRDDQKSILNAKKSPEIWEQLQQSDQNGSSLSESSSTSCSDSSSSSDSTTSSSSDSSSESSSETSSDDDSNDEGEESGQKQKNNIEPTKIRDQTNCVVSTDSITRTLESLDPLLMEDDNDLISKVEMFKNFVEQKRKAKEMSEKLKSDISDSSYSESSKHLIQNGILPSDCDRKKITLRLKSITSLKQPLTDVDNIELLGTKKSTNDNESNKQKRSDDRNQSTNNTRMSEERRSRGSSSSRRRSRRSEERISKRSGEKRSRRSEDRRRTSRNDEMKSRRDNEKSSKHGENKRSKREEHRISRDDRFDRSPSNHHRDAYYSSYRNRSMTFGLNELGLPRGPRTPPNTPPPNSSEYNNYRREFRSYNNQINPMYHTVPRFNSSYHNPSTDASGDPESSMNMFQQIDGPYSHVPPNHGPAFMNNEYVNVYMQTNRNSVGMSTFPTSMHHHSSSSSAMNAPNLNNNHNVNIHNEHFYENNIGPHTTMNPPQLMRNQQHQDNIEPFTNLIELSQYDQNIQQQQQQQQTENRRKSAFAVQKGNVLEIVPNAEPQNDKTVDTAESNTLLDDKQLLEKNSQKASQQQQQQQQQQKSERIRRKFERNQRRLAREKRKEFLMAEINRLSHQLIVGEDGKMIKAGELLKSVVFDGVKIKVISSTNSNGNDTDLDDDDNEPYFEPTVFTYDPNAIPGKSILSDTNSKQSTKKAVLFADGIIPGEGTSSSESSESENDRTTVTKKRKITSRTKSKSELKTPLPSSSDPIVVKENQFELKNDFKDVQNTDEEIVPLPPPGSPPPHLIQPKLKNPEKFLPNHLLYFHYNIHTHEMYISPYSYPTHDAGTLQNYHHHPPHQIQSSSSLSSSSIPSSIPSSMSSSMSYSFKSNSHAPKPLPPPPHRVAQTSKVPYQVNDMNLIVLSNDF